MEELYKWKMINSCETIEELKEAITKIGENGVIEGTSKEFKVEDQLRACNIVWEYTAPLNYLTRNYGIRRQMMYLLTIHRS